MGQSEEAVDAIRRLVGTPLKASGVAPKIELAGDVGSRFDQLMERVRRAAEETPPPEGHTRVFRYGSVPKDYTPPKTVMLFGEEVPIEEYRKWRQDGLAEFNTRDVNPQAAAGRWFTDKADELDYYVRQALPDHKNAYYTDIPSHVLPDYNVTKTPFTGSSLNPEREFVLPEDLANAARRFLDR
jgi:hypothetical protein